MSRFVIDAHALIDLVRDERAVDPAHQLVAPNTIRSQALALLLRSVRRGELTEQEALDLHERITVLKMRLLGDRVSRRTAWRLARENDWDDIRDAEYLAVAKLQADALVSGDLNLASKTAGIVTSAPLAALFL